MNTAKAAVSDKHGVFSLPLHETVSLLVISYTGYRSDTVQITDNSALQVVMASDHQLNTITVTARRKSMFVNTSSAFRATTITSKELMKASAGPSERNQPSVDVSYSDAVTGSNNTVAGTIRELYLFTVENLPTPRIATPLGLNSIAARGLKASS